MAKIKQKYIEFIDDWNKDTVFYSLCYEDILDIAKNEGIKLSKEEIEEIASKYENINCYLEIATLMKELKNETK